MVTNRWVRFLRSWDWDVPEYGGRSTKSFSAGTEILLTHRQHQSAIAAGVVVSIPNPRCADEGESDVCDPV